MKKSNNSNIKGHKLSFKENCLSREKPLGLILFKRNIKLLFK